MKQIKITKEEKELFKRIAYEKRMLRSCLADLSKESDEFWNRIKKCYGFPRDSMLRLKTETGVIKELGGKKDND